MTWQSHTTGSSRVHRLALAVIACSLLAILAAAPAAAQPVLTVSPQSLTFLQDASVQAPPQQTVTITSSPTNVPVQVTGAASWLTYNQNTATTPAFLNVNVVTAGLAVGTYTAQLTVSSSVAGVVAKVINVTLTVTSAPPTNTNPTQLAFNYSIGTGLPESQQFYVNSNAPTFSVGVNQPWMFASVNPGTIPALVTVSVNPFGLGVGTYNGLITVTFGTNPVTYQLVNVTLVIESASSSLWTTSGPITFNYNYGSSPPPVQTLQVSYASIVIYVAEPQSATGWLKIDNNTNTGITPGNIEVSVDPTGLNAGTYAGAIVVSSPGIFGSVTVPITLIVTGSPALSVSPSTMVFDASAGGAPQTKTATISSSPTTGYVASVALGGTWLSITPASGNTPQTMTVAVDPSSLGPGTYRGSIVFSSPGSNSGGQLLGVTLNVTGSVSLTASPTTLQFNATPATPTPAAQAISVTSNFTTTVAAASSATWLTVTPGSATTPANFSIGVVAAGLASGVYNGTITISSPASGQTIQIPVSLTVGGAKPVVTEFSNGAGNLRDFAPGSYMVLTGTDLGPPTQVVAPINGVRQLPTTLGNVRVFMNGVAAPLLSVSATRIQAMVPFEIAGLTRLEVQVANQNVQSDVTTLALADNAPILFTADGSGRGRGAFLNQNGSVNGPGSGATRGTAVLLYGAGGGLFERDLLSGSVVDATGRFRASVSVFIGGVQADVLYAGPAPGMIAGMFQINALVSMDVIPGASLPVTVRVGAGFSQSGVTMAVE
ncbi:MAG: hypothetical protein J0L64_16340 [Acidobacteria bacterium]|nr:hypothetical protein [Acidobacteriota bacterium]